ncbi:DUF1654 domain-containing protein [Pseudomonas sp. NY5710]|uniref:DUF1654 domain-containing protein n=1 Tax=Pseudomonas TaxID=286 RepID=UPI00156FFE41|nr:DUF1654 domain-containing protein [Pseudomonas sp. NY5710]
MPIHTASTIPQPLGMSGVERLSLRVSSMINHPVAQTQRWVLVHRLDSDGDAEWEEVMGLLLDTPELDLTFNPDGSVLVRWQRHAGQQFDEVSVEQGCGSLASAAPF